MVSLRSRRITGKAKQKIFYSDFSRNFDLNPITGALERLINDEAVKQSIQNLCLTQRGERFYHLDVGSEIRRSLFNPLDDITMSTITTSLETTIKNYESRAQNVKINILQTSDFNGYIVNIDFTMVNIPTQLQNMQIQIPRVR